MNSSPSRNPWSLPPSWDWAKVEDVADTTSGGTPRRDKPKFYGGTIPWVKSGELKDGIVYDAEEFITGEGLASSSAKLFPKGTVCIALYGATVGRLGILGLNAATNQAVCGIFHSDAVLPWFLFRFLQLIRPRLIELGKGGAQPNISQSIVRSTLVPIAPINEQRRIVEELDKQFTRLDAAVAALKRVQANLKRYRGAVLKAACEGRIVTTEAELARRESRSYESASVLLERIRDERHSRWEATQRSKLRLSAEKSPADRRTPKYKEKGGPSTNDLPTLPGGWMWATVAQIGDVQLGRQRSPKNRSNHYPTKYIRAANITENGIDLTDVLDMEFLPQERRRYELHFGDLVLSEASGSPAQVGKPALWRDELPGCCFQNTVIRHRPYFVSSEYLLCIFKNYYWNGLFSKIAGGVGINHLSAEKFSSISVPIPPFAEQSRIVAEVERRLSVLEELQTQVEANQRRAERLRQSILKRAFEAKLVPQDPEDEPARARLERIRTKRGAKAQEMKTKRRKVVTVT